MFGWTATVWLHLALLLELAAPARALVPPCTGVETIEPRFPVQDQGEDARLEAGVGEDVGRVGRGGQGDRPGQSQGGGAEQSEEATSGTPEEVDAHAISLKEWG